MDVKRKIRILLARLGLDSHWRGNLVVARALSDAGMEVIYVGNQSPEMIVQTVLQESPDIIGLSTLSGNHLILVPKIIELLSQKTLKDVPIILGGIIPQNDAVELKKIGVTEIFGPGTPLIQIITSIKEKVQTPNF